MELEPFVFCHTGSLLAAREMPEREEEDLVDRMAVINRFTLRPLAADEVAVFMLELCNNQVDRHFSRFPEEELQRINWLTPGRPLMERHDLRGSLPRGTFFRSQVHRSGEYVSVRPEVYVLRAAANRDFILNIEGGVYRETSIGFSFRLPECSICGKDLRTCAHVPGKQYGDRQCHFIMHDVLDVVEGSVVPAGSQGTRFIAQRTHPSREDQLLTPAAALIRARDAYHLPIEVQGNAWARE